MFKLHPVLENDTCDITQLEVCRVQLMEDANYPWVIVVPQRPDLRDLDELTELDRRLVMDEVDRVAKAMKAVFNPYKMNVAALGNVVEQLHIHVIARFQHDPAWPKPVWGAVEPAPYDETLKADVIKRIREQLRG